ncbi:hypothetical protein PO857_003152 [Pectobacterium carotovorum]|uniref:hypothetical protein n=1 Tax=Pectobacterium carotovorum TaxID=554 RepID=UPI00254C6F5F|nr:hypothetical protein [Pectobacterium carotovorum]MDK9420840.1 hypothetical protein [Pectobacterium carotovorum]
MMDQKSIEKVFGEMARIQGHELNGQDKLMIRTRISSTLAAKKRHCQRMESGAFVWRKPESLRR